MDKRMFANVGIPGASQAMRRRAPLLMAGILTVMAPAAGAQIQFEDASAEAGLSYAGESYGASVGYANTDSLPDFFVNRHRNPAALLINLGDGSFENRGFEIDAWQATPRSDQHGGTFADFDNDGDSDLMVSAGANYATQFLVNNGQYYSDKVTEYTFDRVQWGARLPVWFDFTNDGRLDFGMAVQGAALQMFERTDTDFDRVNFRAEHECDNNDYSLLADINFDGVPDLVCVSQFVMPQRIYDYASGYPFLDISAYSASFANVLDTVVADFDNDLVPEFFGPRGRIRISGAELTGAQSAEAHLIDQNGSSTTVTFRSTGDVRFEIHWNARNANRVRIGAADIPAPTPPDGEPIAVTVSPADPNSHGMPSFDPAVDDGIYIGFDPATSVWTMVHASGDRPDNSYTYTYIDSTAALDNLDVSGLLALDQARQPLLLKYDSAQGRFTDQVVGTGLEGEIKCASAVAADFDNDMDQDLYLVCRNAVSNAANILYVNDGTGHFTPLAGAGGAAGPTGFGVGLGENVVTTDYDLDGFVDLLVLNGLKLFPEEPYGAGGPEKLFRNLGNGNRWIEIDLEGVLSNRDGIGATVTVTAGGVTQRREQNGGYHRWAQNDKRLHFGLAANTTANVEVRWPSGTIDNYTAVPANRIYRLREGGNAPITVTPPGDVPPSVCERTAGAPTIDSANDFEIFIWQDACGTPFKVRVAAASGPPELFSGHVRSDAPFESVTGVQLEATDILTLDSAQMELTYGLTVGGGSVDGFNMQPADNASVCFGIESNRPTALVGPDRIRVNLPVNLRTLETCTIVNPIITIANTSALESNSAGVMTFELSLDFAVPYEVSVKYATFDGTATAGADYEPASGTVVFAPNTSTARIDIPIVDDDEVEFAENFGVTLFDPSGAVLGNDSAIGTIDDDDPGACGAPTFDPATDRGLYVWQDCGSAEWFVRAVGGGVNRTYRGRVQSDAPFATVVPFNIEGSDVLDFTTDPARIEYAMEVGNSGQDGFQFEIAGTAACLELDSPDVKVFVGAQRNPLTPPFDLVSLGSCYPATANLVTVLSLASGDPKPREGSTVVLNVNVFNDGSDADGAVTVDIPLPAGLVYESHSATQGSYDPATGAWSIGTLNGGADATLSLSAAVAAGQAGRKIGVAIGAATGAQPDPTPSGDVLSLTLSVPPRRVPVEDDDGSGGSGNKPVVEFANRVRSIVENFVELRWLGGRDESARAPEPAPPGGAAGGPGLQGPAEPLSMRRANGRAPGDPGRTMPVLRRTDSSGPGAGRANDTGVTLQWVVVTDPIGTAWSAGLAADADGASFAGFRYARGWLVVSHEGSEIGDSVPLAQGDSLSIRVTGIFIEYRKNGMILATAETARAADFRRVATSLPAGGERPDGASTHVH
ncbi:MAG TPA: FG-GAP-like repeat-containing protein [Woeseiaceae bacterium]|nr:FG-GAP-like repeat-containing protein [Woeseiaceae bacterium]